jgi:hypothetical protein
MLIACFLSIPFSSPRLLSPLYHTKTATLLVLTSARASVVNESPHGDAAKPLTKCEVSAPKKYSSPAFSNHHVPYNPNSNFSIQHVRSSQSRSLCPAVCRSSFHQGCSSAELSSETSHSFPASLVAVDSSPYSFISPLGDQETRQSWYVWLCITLGALADSL